ncbi:hypothetical protein [Nitrincola tibetensis]|uniref:hypothetical protein n=1 Tax=Nitrincola tibetensis TaxID=2219697 RepID=UPI001057B0B4|nr:hypothetical protein [Nitrincola tibetensis]
MRYIAAIILTAGTLSLNGCAAEVREIENTNFEPVVQWYEGFMLPNYLATPRKVENQKEVHSMLFEQWNTAYDIVTEHNPDEVVSISSCNEYLSRQYDGLSTVLEYGYAYFRMVATMCHAAELIASAQPPTASTLTYPIDGKMLPQQLPSEVAFIASESYRADLLRNPKVQTWADVLEVLDNQIVEFSSESPNQFHFE